MQVGLSLPQLGGQVTRGVLQGFCERAEELGFRGFWVQQHLFYPRHPISGYVARPGLAIPERYRSIMAPLETLTAAAAWTSEATLGTSVLVAGYHRPVDLAQRLSTLDILSEGRLVVGFSVGWSDDEHAQMDVDPRTRARAATSSSTRWSPAGVRIRCRSRVASSRSPRPTSAPSRSRIPARA